MKYAMEYEAKEKWCPFANVALGEEASANRPYKDNFHDSCRCLGSGCMAWKYANPKTVCDDGEDEGYCGLAGAK